MSKTNEERTCPACGKRFLCRAADIANCECMEVAVSLETQEELIAEFGGTCLCAQCLKQYEAQEP